MSPLRRSMCRTCALYVYIYIFLYIYIYIYTKSRRCINSPREPGDIKFRILFYPRRTIQPIDQRCWRYRLQAGNDAAKFHARNDRSLTFGVAEEFYGSRRSRYRTFQNRSRSGQMSRLSAHILIRARIRTSSSPVLSPLPLTFRRGPRNRNKSVGKLRDAEVANEPRTAATLRQRKHFPSANVDRMSDVKM